MTALRLLVPFALGAFALAAQSTDAAALKASLDATGRASVYGVPDVIPAGDSPALGSILQLLWDNPELKVRIEAHTAAGDNFDRLKLQRQLHMIRVWLVERGADPRQFSTMAVGDRRPIGDNATAEGRVINRRIDLVKQ